MRERDTKSGKEFWVLSNNGRNYGTRNKSLADYLKQGNTIEFCWIENRGHRIVTTLRKVPSKDQLSITSLSVGFTDWNKSKEEQKINSGGG